MTQNIPALNDALIHWFEQNKADLPWRRTSDPYAIWLSEIMLQQTQVYTVIPYYERFLARFPTVQALAAASLDDVLKLWEGLGYYSRARNLHRAAQMVVNELGGVFPGTVPELLTLPGVGRYTAGAIASLAFGQDVPVLDGNVIRILTRLFDISDDVTETATKNALWVLAEQLVPAGRAGPWNEGLMELGRVVCTPQSPACGACPVAAFCAARENGVQHERPVKSPKTRTPHYDVTAAVIRHAKSARNWGSRSRSTSRSARCATPIHISVSRCMHLCAHSSTASRRPSSARTGHGPAWMRSTALPFQ